MAAEGQPAMSMPQVSLCQMDWSCSQALYMNEQSWRWSIGTMLASRKEQHEHLAFRPAHSGSCCWLHWGQVTNTSENILFEFQSRDSEFPWAPQMPH